MLFILLILIALHESKDFIIEKMPAVSCCTVHLMLMVSDARKKGTLIGRLLTRTMLKQRGVPPTQMIFGVTEAGKPYIVRPLLLWHIQLQMPYKKTAGIDPPIAYNVSHDNALVAMIFAPGIYGPPAYNVGIDVMKVRIPGRDTFTSFVDTMGDQVISITPPKLFFKALDSSVNAS